MHFTCIRGPHGHDIPKRCNGQFSYLSSKISCFLQANLAHQHACICIPSILCFLSRGAQLFFLSRASRERGLGDGACVRVATVHNTSPSSLAPKLLARRSRQDKQTRTTTQAVFRRNLLSRGKAQGRSRKSSPRSKLKFSQEIPCRHQRHLHKEFSPSRAKYRNSQTFQ